MRRTLHVATRPKEQFGQGHWTNLNKRGMFQKQKESKGGWRVVKKQGVPMSKGHPPERLQAIWKRSMSPKQRKEGVSGTKESNCFKSGWEFKQEKHKELANGFGKVSNGDPVKSSFSGADGIKSLLSVLNWGRRSRNGGYWDGIILQRTDVIRRRPTEQYLWGMELRTFLFWFWTLVFGFKMGDRTAYTAWTMLKGMKSDTEVSGTQIAVTQYM